MTSPTQIVDQILAIVRADATLKGVKQWFLGEPAPSRINGYPSGWVEWMGGLKEPPVPGKQVIRDSFAVAVICQHADCEKAEREGMTLAETVETVFKNHSTVDGKVSSGWVSNREKQKLFSQEKDYSIVAVRVTLSSWRRE